MAEWTATMLDRVLRDRGTVVDADAWMRRGTLAERRRFWTDLASTSAFPDLHAAMLDELTALANGEVGLAGDARIAELRAVELPRWRERAERAEAATARRAREADAGGGVRSPARAGARPSGVRNVGRASDARPHRKDSRNTQAAAARRAGKTRRRSRPARRAGVRAMPVATRTDGHHGQACGGARAA